MNCYDLKWSTVQFRHGCSRMAESDKNWAKWNNGKDKSLSHSEKWNGLISRDPLHYLFLFKVFSQWKPFLQSLFYFYVSCMRPMSLQYANFRHFKVWSIKTYLPCFVRAISIVFHWLEVTGYILGQKVFKIRQSSI